MIRPQEPLHFDLLFAQSARLLLTPIESRRGQRNPFTDRATGRHKASCASAEGGSSGDARTDLSVASARC